jgi:hypothetical protein
MKRLWNVTVTGLVLAGFLYGASGTRAATAEPNAAAQKKPEQTKPAVEDPNKPETVIVARIGEYTVNKAQLEGRLAQEVMPQREYEGEPNRVVTVQGVLDQMIAEKAMVIEGRKLGYLDHKDIKPQIDRVRQRSLIQLMLEDYVRDNLAVTDAEVQAQQKTDPNLTAEQAKVRVQRVKVNPLLDQFYAKLLEKYKVKKLSENFAKVSQIHQRLLTQPAKRDKNIYWITGPQIEEELTPEEKGLVLATFEGGRLTLTDWLGVLNDMVPPSRPKNLDTVEGVDKFTDQALQGPVLMAEAIARGYDKNAKHLETMRAVEENNLMGKVLGDKLSNIPEPNESQIKAYFEKHAARFGSPASMKIDQIWCKDLAAAQEIKKQLAGGAAFETIKKEQSLRKDEPAHDTWPTSEGIFWDDLRKAEPNTVVGPVKGFFDPRIKWRVVKVLEKKPAVSTPYSDSMKDRVKEAEMTDRMLTMRRDFEKQMLAKYPHEVSAAKIKDIDPLEVSADSAPTR